MAVMQRVSSAGCRRETVYHRDETMHPPSYPQYRHRRLPEEISSRCHPALREGRPV